MKVTSHHVALRTTDLDRATQFYVDVFGGRVVMELDLEQAFVESIFSAPPGTNAKNRFIVFDEGAIELFQFLPSRALGATDQNSTGIMHFCLWVDDVVGTVARAETAGGKARFPVRPWQGRHFVYVEDPDGHVIELLDATVEECISLANDGKLPDVERSA